MAEQVDLDQIRRAALDFADQSKRLWVKAAIVAGIVEAGGWITYILLAYYGFSVAVLIAVASMIVYALLFVGGIGLSWHIDICTQRVLKAIESRDPESA